MFLFELSALLLLNWNTWRNKQVIKINIICSSTLNHMKYSKYLNHCTINFYGQSFRLSKSNTWCKAQVLYWYSYGIWTVEILTWLPETYIYFIILIIELIPASGRHSYEQWNAENDWSSFVFQDQNPTCQKNVRGRVNMEKLGMKQEIYASPEAKNLWKKFCTMAHSVTTVVVISYKLK